WYGAAGGVSYVGFWETSQTTNNHQFKTNWTFSNNLGNGFPKFVAEAAAHENGHAAGLSHQARWAPGSPPTLEDAYDNGQTTGAGQFSSHRISPTMGVGYNADRSTWRHGATNSNSSNTAQNDVLRIQQNNGMTYTNTATNTTGFFDAGIGRTTATATALPLTGNTINSTLAKGIITPLSSTDPNPIGTNNYTKDYFKFTVENGLTGNLNATLKSGYFTNNSGTTENPGWTLNATLRLLASDGVTQLAISNSSDYLENITINSLTAGTYYLEISSAGGFTDSYGNKYYDMGGYTLLGTFTPVPEPATVIVLAAGMLAAGGWLRRRTTATRPDSEPTTEQIAC
nr:PEP-CTERM sorting domain-containing protein [Fimbriiglobus sp.]